MSPWPGVMADHDLSKVPHHH
jgi:hypothetical protein